MSWSDLAARAHAVQYSTFGVAATYTPPAGAAVSCRVIRREPEPDPLVQFAATAITTPAHLIEVRASEVAAPVVGGVFAIGSESLTVRAAPRHPLGDHDRLLWLLECTA